VSAVEAVGGTAVVAVVVVGFLLFVAFLGLAGAIVALLGWIAIGFFFAPGGWRIGTPLLLTAVSISMVWG